MALSFVAPDTEAWMRKLLMILFSLCAGCGQSGGAPGDESGNRASAAPAPAPRAVQTATLTGLYESTGTPPGQLCITEQGRTARFGLVTRQNGRPGCSGAGAAVRNGAVLRLTMDGDSACAIEARIDGGRVTFPASLPRGCAYYCAPGVRAAGASFAKTGGARADAARARDIVGDPLCT
jgi:hypothetical protein